MLSVLYAAITSELAAINAYTVPLVGEVHVASAEPPPKMIFIPSDDTFGPAEGPGGNPRPIATIMAATELVLQGATTDHVEGMRDQFVIALRRACKHASMQTARAGRYAISKGKWTRGVALRVKNGVEYRLTFAVAFPVVERTWETPLPGDPPQAPLPGTYTGDQANTYPVIPGGDITIDANVSPKDAPDADRVHVTVTTP